MKTEVPVWVPVLQVKEHIKKTPLGIKIASVEPTNSNE
jgi:hypothetical protein